jgi:hypothetical protein
MNTFRTLGFSALIGLGLASVSSAVTVGQQDTFEDGSTQGWVNNLLGMGSATPPANVPSGGPGGTDDAFLRIVSAGGSGSGSRLVALNLAQWAGNYIASGVTSIRMNVINEGATELTLRLMFSDPAGAPPTNIAVSTDGVTLPASSGWRTIEFPASPSHLTALAGGVVPALTGTTEMRIFHSPTPVNPPEPIAGQLGVDNITAVPLPAALPAALITLGAGAILRARKRRQA